MRAPYVPLRKEEIQKANAKAAFVGIPFEGGNFSRPGSSAGPQAMRAIASGHLASYLFEYDIDIFESYNLVDCGDIDVVPMNISRTIDNIEAGIFEILSAGAMPIICGGDHSIPIGSVKALTRNTKGKVGYIHIDAHLDCAEEVGGNRLSNCSPVSRAIDQSGVNPKNIAMIGIRGTQNNRKWFSNVKKYGIRIFTMPEVWEKGMVDVAKECLEIAGTGTDAIYVSLDTDSLDASAAPGTTSPEPYGITAKEIVLAAKTLGSARFCEKIQAFDLVELCPQYDLSGISALLMGTAVLTFMASRARTLKDSH